MRHWEGLEEGEPFTTQDVRAARPACLLGATVARELFGADSPVGKQVHIGGTPFKVMGVLARHGKNQLVLDEDDIVLAPWTAVKSRVTGGPATGGNQSPAGAGTVPGPVAAYDPSQPSRTGSAPSLLFPQASPDGAANTPLSVRTTRVDQIQVRAEPGKEVAAVRREVEELLRRRHRIHEGRPDDFDVRIREGW